MKTLKKAFIAIILVNCFVANPVKSQNNKATILGLSQDINDTTRVIEFDCSTGKYDTLCVSPKNLIGTNGASVLDPYRKIFYTINNHLNVIDLNNNIVKNIDIPNQLYVISDMQYDIFTDELLIRTSDSLFAYCVHTNTTRAICSLPYSNNVINGAGCTYDNFAHMYYYYTVNGNDDEYISVDVANGTVLQDLNVSGDGGGHQLAISNGKLIGLIGSNSSKPIPDVCFIDTTTSTYTKICSMPADYYSGMNALSSGFSTNGDFYISPYASNNNYAGKVAIVDIKNSSVTSIPFSSDFWEDQIYNAPKPALILSNQRLQANYYSQAYTWYLNGSMIPGQNEQYLQPTASGIYKFSIVEKGQTIFSNELNYNNSATAIKYLFEANKLTLLPNPSAGYFTLKLNDENGFIQNYKFLVFSLDGRMLKSMNILSGETSIDVHDFSDGMYMSSLYDSNGKILSRQKIIITQ